MDLPNNHNQRWSKYQEEHLLMRIAGGMIIDDIAKIQSRTSSAIISRLGKLLTIQIRMESQLNQYIK